MLRNTPEDRDHLLEKLILFPGHWPISHRTPEHWLYLSKAV